MKKSKLVSLVLITATLASCNKTDTQKGASGDWDEKTDKKVYMRSDSTASYTRTHHHSGIGTALLWYYAFRPYGSSMGYNNGYNRTGFYSRGLSQSSNIGSNAVKSNISRGGFGGRAFSRSSTT